VENYAEVVREKYIKRELIALSGDVANLAFDEGKEISEILDSAEKSVMEISKLMLEKTFCQ
jgi:replicative DNA helicase